MFDFLLTTIAVSLSGVMAPGPITAATLAAGARRRHAGALIALGHAMVEMPLILLLVAGMGGLLQSSAARAGIGLAGGTVLVLMGLQLLASVRNPIAETEAPVQRHPSVIGIVLTAANPYFLVWWATVGLTLAVKAMEFGALVLVLFAAVHWLCDLAWLEVLSVAGFKGSEVFGKRAQTAVSAICGIVLVGFGAKFLYDAGIGSWQPVLPSTEVRMRNAYDRREPRDVRSRFLRAPLPDLHEGEAGNPVGQVSSGCGEPRNLRRMSVGASTATEVWRAAGGTAAGAITVRSHRDGGRTSPPNSSSFPSFPQEFSEPPMIDIRIVSCRMDGDPRRERNGRQAHRLRQRL